MAQTKTRRIPKKNYVVAIAVVVVVVLLTLYIFQWKKVYDEGKIATSYLIKSNTISNEMKGLDEIESVFTEAPAEYFVYISYVNSEEVYNLEKDLKKVIDDFNLKDNFYYLNATSLMKETDYLEKINKAFGLTDQKITKLPTILFFRDGKLATDGIVKREDDQMIQASDFRQLLDIKEITRDSH